jgi:hypothetical protein
MPVVHCVELSSEFFFFTCKEETRSVAITVSAESQVRECCGEPQSNLEVVWHRVELIHMVRLLAVARINHLAPLLRQFGLQIPQPSTNNRLVLSNSCIRKRHTREKQSRYMLGSSMVTAVSCAKVSWRTRSSFSASPAADAPPPRPRAEEPLVEAATGSAGTPSFLSRSFCMYLIPSRATLRGERAARQREREGVARQETGEGWEGVPAGVLVVGAVVGIRVDAALAEVFPHGWALLGSDWVGPELWPARRLGK